MRFDDKSDVSITTNVKQKHADAISPNHFDCQMCAIALMATINRSLTSFILGGLQFICIQRSLHTTVTENTKEKKKTREENVNFISAEYYEIISFSVFPSFIACSRAG